MGTSKGYIAPSTPNWASAKRGVSDFISHPTESNKQSAAAKFAMQKFAQLFDKHIMNKCDSVVVARTREKDIKEYIYYTVKFKLTDDEITEINPRDIANEHIIKDIIKKAFDILEHYYD